MEADPWALIKTHKFSLIIIGIGVLIYFNMLFNGFVWDDKTYIINNPQIHTLNILALIKENLFNMSGQYRPIPSVYFAYLFALFGDTSFPYHIIQLFLHVTNALLVFFFFKKNFTKYIALFLSLIFLIHPMQVESVSYIAAASSELFFLFGFVALWISQKHHLSKKNAIALLFFLTLSLLTKESGIQFFIVVPLYRFLLKKQGVKIILGIEGISLFLYFFVRFFIGGVFFSIRPLVPIAHLSLLGRLSNVPAILFYYLKTFFFPVSLAIDQQWVIRNINVSNFYFPLFVDLLALFAVVFTGLMIYKRYKSFFALYLFFSIWFIVGIGLYTQIFPIDGTVADRWFYFPIIGLLGIFGILYESFIRKHLNNKLSHKVITIALGIAIIALLSIRTIVRNTNWENAILLYSHDITVSENVDLENNLGNEYLESGDYTKALSHYNKAIDPYSLEFNLQNIGATYAKMGNFTHAKVFYEKSFTVNNHNIYFPHKHDSSSYINYAQVLIVDENPSIALNFIQNALQDYPDSSDLWMDLALLKYKNHQTKDAIAAITKAFQINPYAQYATIYEHIQRNEPINITLGGKTFVFSSQ